MALPDPPPPGPTPAQPQLTLGRILSGVIIGALTFAIGGGLAIALDA